MGLRNSVKFEGSSLLKSALPDSAELKGAEFMQVVRRRIAEDQMEVVPVVPDTHGPLRVLVVDDSRAQRMVLSSQLRRAGYIVADVDCGQAALDITLEQSFDLILSDWMMPGMSGPELCTALRARNDPVYIYFILLTSKNEQAEIAEGLERGADDFLTKPVNGDELRARIKAGARIVTMQQELTEKNRLIGETLGELQYLYDQIDRDLMEASKLQQSLMHERFHEFDTGSVSLLLRSSGRVGGDLAGFFRASASQLGLYSLDVSGHGITSALMTARLAGHLSTSAPEHNIALSHLAGDEYQVLPPQEVVQRFNNLMSSSIETEHYFTICIGFVDLLTGRVCMSQAGHPHPLVQRRDGSVEYHGEGGLPVGLIDGATFDQFEFQLTPGDRLLLCSDGITECPGAQSPMLDEDGLAAMMIANKTVTGPALLEALVHDLTSFHGNDSFPDDVSAALFEFRGPKGGTGRTSGADVN